MSTFKRSRQPTCTEKQSFGSLLENHLTVLGLVNISLVSEYGW